MLSAVAGLKYALPGHKNPTIDLVLHQDMTAVSIFLLATSCQSANREEWPN